MLTEPEIRQALPEVSFTILQLVPYATTITKRRSFTRRYYLVDVINILRIYPALENDKARDDFAIQQTQVVAERIRVSAKLNSAKRHIRLIVSHTMPSTALKPD